MLFKGNEDAVFIEQKRMAGALGNKEKKKSVSEICNGMWCINGVSFLVEVCACPCP